MGNRPSSSSSPSSSLSSSSSSSSSHSQLRRRRTEGHFSMRRELAHRRSSGSNGHGGRRDELAANGAKGDHHILLPPGVVCDDYLPRAPDRVQRQTSLQGVMENRPALNEPSAYESTRLLHVPRLRLNSKTDGDGPSLRVRA